MIDRIDKHLMLEMWMKAITRKKVIMEEDKWGHGEDGEWERGKVYHFYTSKYRYHVVAVDRSKDDGYLGCQVSTRMPRAGENWNRGNDLSDGPFVHKTWEKIKNSILGYELVEITGSGVPDGMTERE